MTPNENKKEDEKNFQKDQNKSLENNFVLERIYNESKVEPLTINITNITTKISNGIDGKIPIISFRV